MQQKSDKTEHTKREYFTMRITSKLNNRLQDIAYMKGISKSQAVREALKQYTNA